uniref:non-specific serine/threonine protein kinase n=1 Tax=Nothobranchius furzeri TaxID=105023 RepID=A0A8C6LAJ7_NOTFU
MMIQLSPCPLLNTVDSRSVRLFSPFKVNIFSFCPSVFRFTRRADELAGSQPMLVSWFKDDKEIHSDDKYRLEFSDSAASVTITGLDQSHAGVYECRVSNEAGLAQTSGALMVKGQTGSTVPSCVSLVELSSQHLPAHVYYESSCSFTEAPTFSMKLEPSRLLKAQQPLRLSCKVQGTPVINVSWFKNGSEVRADRRHTMSYDSSVASLEVEDCCVEDSSAPLNIQWMKDRRELKSSDSTKITLVGGAATLDISSVSKSDAGDYLCKASNATGSDFCKSKVTVKGKQGTATFIAKIGGDPIPSVKWMKGKWRQVTPGGRISIEHKGQDAKLEIREVTKSDSGLYRCVASNKHGEIECGAEMEVTKKDEAEGFGDIRSRLKKSGSGGITVGGFRFQVTGLIEGQWYAYRVRALNKLGASRPCRATDEIQAVDARGRLNFSRLTQLSSMELLTTFFLLNILTEPPEIQLDVKLLAGLTTRAGSKIELPADVKGQPDPRVKWTKADLVLRADDRIAIDTQPGHSKLSISNTSRGDTATYIIEAVNLCAGAWPTGSLSGVCCRYTEKPDPPIQVEARDPTSSSVTVTWKAPDYDGGCPIQGYTVEKIEKDGDRYEKVTPSLVPGFSYVVTGLKEDMDYEFRVFAENIAGISEPSLTSDPIKATRAITKPGPPGNLKLKDWSKSYADICWTKPTRDGGSPILGYVVEAQKSGTAQWDRINKDLIKICAYRVPGLIEGLEYRIRIRATNKVGDSEPRELPETILAKDILVPPEIVVDVSCRDSVTVRAGQIISLITRVKGRPDPEITWTKDARALSRDKRTEINNNYPLCELIINDVVRSDYGKYAISAKNSSGQAQATILVNVLDTPGACQNLKVAYVTKKSCMVSWENPEDNGGTEITQYIIECRQPSQRGWTVVSNDWTKRLIKAPLTEGCEYFFRVSAENKIGSGPATETKLPILAIDPIEKPGEPIDFQISEIGKTFCFLKWKKPDYDGGSRNLGYHIEKKPKEAEEWERIHKGAIKETYFMADRCVENQIYQFRVQTKNEGGESNWVTTGEVLVKEQLVEPEVKIKLDGTLVVKAGDSIPIEATMKGKPQPDVKWSKDESTDEIRKEKAVFVNVRVLGRSIIGYFTAGKMSVKTAGLQSYS